MVDMCGVQQSSAPTAALAVSPIIYVEHLLTYPEYEVEHKQKVLDALHSSFHLSHFGWMFAPLLLWLQETTTKTIRRVPLCPRTASTAVLHLQLSLSFS